MTGEDKPKKPVFYGIDHGAGPSETVQIVISGHQAGKSFRIMAERRLAEEQARVEDIRARGAVPDACGPDIPAAPARGPVRAFDIMANYPKGDREFEAKPAGYKGRKTMQIADVFDLMRLQAAKRKGTCGLTPAQVDMGRRYRALVERHDAGGVRCSSVEAMPASKGGSPDGFTDARLASARQIDSLRRRIGTGVAIEVRRVRPSDRGPDKRRPITDRALVDAVCIADKSVSAVLKAHGWGVNKVKVAAATKALAAALDRMIGPVGGRGVQVIRTDLPRWPE